LPNAWRWATQARWAAW